MRSKLHKQEDRMFYGFIVVLAVMVAVALLIAVISKSSQAGATETCPDGDGWEKIDGLSGYEYTYQTDDSCQVVKSCYKHATYVHYGENATVKADEHCSWQWVGNRFKYVCKTHELSHASFKVKCEEPEPTPTPTPTPTLTPEPTPEPCEECCKEDECEPEPTPQPTPEPTPESSNNSGGEGKHEAPVCSDGHTAKGVANLHVLRSGSQAVVNFFITDGDHATVFWRLSGTSGWEHSSVQTQPDGLKPNFDGFVSYTISDLGETTDYDFGVVQSQGCGSGEYITAVVVDDYQPKLFPFTHWEWMN